MEPAEHLERVFGNPPKKRAPFSSSLVRFVQEASQEWREANFPPDHRTTEMQALGIAEEAGELCHAVLKRVQGIRGTPEEHLATIADALGDLFIYSCGVASNEGLDLHDIYRKTWDAVARRDWTQHKETGYARETEEAGSPSTEAPPERPDYDERDAL